ncbi:MAG: DUF2157 domain-containing protein [Gammaproteobacteria bacterium]|uniref:DUF2157 domain-containing protein n=1 Tax=Rhodoferax sp. TaxID=50421 RepID=UPI001796144B|nr:DUF2157 domain-containing protein [Rhodoferax sp.]MBU3898650.1 DUF2157 domain-containing protein [Gammaproteobacteria bacterium]MBA3057033.1 DUF2157 domain-containing protein [Rhodoferax sp.]MBU3997753.1 DUF2157 domain-containing protein [Gammaproteobacteria bacterium]MBU4019559.1 DUF2157 domain-containing protein [Gammaproteobacteria bacterium]MBU4079073.1 DUF2157 domain-containing protein [Gammaproteobacteria bacterium]
MQFLQAASRGDEPATLAVWLPRGVAVLAAALGGLGVVMWIAAHWDSMGRLGHFALLQGLVLATGAGAALIPRARAPLGLLALLGIGGLFAYFGQTYQTGADPWQLFALWAALALPLCLGARSDVLWAPWALVVMTAISLWVHTYSGHRWSVQPGQLQVHLLAWTATLTLVGALSSHWQRYTGAGVWGFRSAVTLAVVAVTMTAMGGLFFGTVKAQYPLGVVLLALAAGLLSTPRLFEVFALSAVALGLNALLVGGLVRWLGEGSWNGDWLGRLLLIGLFAAGLLAASVSAILRLSRRALAQGAPA